jgi:DNA (cytosine-5)-methyltransferase 1
LAQDLVTTGQAIGDLPKLRSGISRFGGNDSERWYEIRSESANESAGFLGTPLVDLTATTLQRGAAFVARSKRSKSIKCPDLLTAWLSDPNLDGFIQHEARSHMESDLHRYLFAAAYAEVNNESPKLRDFPKSLLPNHANASSALRPFEDRFRVQLANAPATTIVSHIAKDGHYYIHPDPMQMRSLTVREAARLQTFPDNYFFCGNRTQQYHQVGNAVPPLLAYQIAEIVAEILG